MLTAATLVGSLVPQIDATYRTIVDRIGRAIAGCSTGGAGALRYSLVHPDLFGAAIVLSPAVYFPLPPSDSSTGDFGAFGNGTDLFPEATSSYGSMRMGRSCGCGSPEARAGTRAWRSRCPVVRCTWAG